MLGIFPTSGKITAISLIGKTLELFFAFIASFFPLIDEKRPINTLGQTAFQTKSL